MSDQKSSVPWVLHPLFKPGNFYGTPGALRAAEAAEINLADLLTLHVCGDWGALSEEDRMANKQALVHGGRIFSNYEVGSGASKAKIWLITDGDRTATCAMRPEEY